MDGNLKLVIIFLLLLCGCSRQLTINKHVDGVKRQDIGVYEINGFILKELETRKDSDNYTFKDGRKTVHYHRTSNPEDYVFDLETRKYKEFFDVDKVNGKIIRLNRTVENKSFPQKKTFFEYFTSGILCHQYTISFINDSLPNYQLATFYSDKVMFFSESGRLIYLLNLNKAIRPYELIKYVFKEFGETVSSAEPLYYDKQRDLKEWEKASLEFPYKLNTLYVKVFSYKKNEPDPDVNSRILNSRTGKILLTKTYRITHIE